MEGGREGGKVKIIQETNRNRRRKGREQKG